MKPVAYMYKTDDTCHMITQVRQDAEALGMEEIELFAQSKPLSDEEIHDIWKSLWEGGNIGHIAYTYARAIEERHGIK